MLIQNMRLPTQDEWWHLLQITDTKDKIIHWSEMRFWSKNDLTNPNAEILGGDKGHTKCSADKHSRLNYIGFRPAFDIMTYPGHEDYKISKRPITACTLYMNDKPVKVPKNPAPDGDIQDYIPNATLRFGEPILNPDYQIKAFNINGVLIADRVILKNINYLETLGGIKTYFVTRTDMKTHETQIADIAKTKLQAWTKLYDRMNLEIQLLNDIEAQKNNHHILPMPSTAEACKGWHLSINDGDIFLQIADDSALICDGGTHIRLQITSTTVDPNFLLDSLPRKITKN